jgi:amino acid transporter
MLTDEVKNPRRVIPRATVGTCVFLAFVFFAVIFAIVGVVPWYGEDGFVEKVLSGHSAANYVMSTFTEILFGRPFAIFFTLVVVYTIFGSCFALLLGYAFIPYSAARDRYFYAWFGHEHATKKGLADYSLLALGAISSVLCFVDLRILIEGMLTTRLIIQFMAQAIGVVILRKKAPNAIRVYTVRIHSKP